MSLFDALHQAFSISLEENLKEITINVTITPVKTEPKHDLVNYTINAGEIAEIVKTDIGKYNAIVVTVRATYDANATDGVRVRWLYSPDGNNYDTPDDAEAQGNYEDLSFSAGSTKQRTILIPILCNNVKIQIVNRDQSCGVTVDVWTVLIR